MHTSDQQRIAILNPLLTKGGAHLAIVFKQEVLIETILACIFVFSGATIVLTEPAIGGGRADLVLSFSSFNVIIELKRKSKHTI